MARLGEAAMPDVPSLKATLFQQTANEIESQLRSGRLTRETLERQLWPEDLRYLGKQLAASSWVPIATCVRVQQILIDLYAHDSPEEFFRAWGEKGAAMVHGLGLYKQFEASTERWGANAGRILLTFASVAYNFMRWSFEPGDHETPARVRVEDARDFPESFRIATEGFIAYMWKVTSKADAVVTSERSRPGEVVFTIRDKESTSER
jgi:hypothetical protein